jgi:adenylate cyclase
MTGQQAWMLVVDDDAVRRMTLFRLLEREGHRATVADGGEAALAMLRAEPFDVVLLGVSSLGLEAPAMLGRFRADQTLRRVPVLVTCAEQDTSLAVRCLEAGADDLLTEPFDPVLLRARVTLCLARKRLADLEAEHQQERCRIVEPARPLLQTTTDPGAACPDGGHARD